jgi:hypothetical protein
MANPNPNNNTPNQSTTPIDLSIIQVGDKTVDLRGTDFKKDDGFSSRIGRSTTGYSYEEMQNFDWAKFNENLRTSVVEKSYDNLWTGTGKWVGSTLNSAASFLLDIGGALFDPADWRLPDVPADVDSEFRETRSGGYVNGIFKWLDNNTVFGDTEDETGNWMTRTASDWREYNQVYRSINSGNEYADFWLNGSANIVGSALGTFGYGAATKYGLQAARFGLRSLQGLTAAQQAVRMGEGISTTQKILSTGAGAFIMTQATGMSIAEDVHEKVYKLKLYELSPSLAAAEQSEYDKVYNEVLNETKNANDAEYAAIKAQKEFRKNFAEQNPELHKSAIKSAGKGAEASLQMMFPAFLLNLSMASAFTNAFIGGVKNKVTRNIISKSPYSKRGLLWEGVQETIEEAGVENVAEDYGIAVGLGKDYTVSDAWNKVFAWDNIGTAALAFVGGTATKAVIDFASRGEHKKRYEEQQQFIKRWNEIGAAVGQPDVVEQLTAPVRNAQELNKILREVEKLKSEGKVEEAKAASKKILAVQAYDAYMSGTTQILIDNWTQIANSKDVKPEAREAARIAVQEIISMENEFNDSLQYENGRSVFKNRINQKQDTKLAQELKNKIIEKRTQAQLEVGLLKQAGKLDLSYDETIEENKEVVFNPDGTIKEVVTPTRTEKKEIELELTPKGYVSKAEGIDASKQIKQIKEQVKPYQEFLDLQEELEATEIRIAEHNSVYAKMTDKSLQKNLRYQNMVLQEYQSMKGDLEELLGTDEYMKEVDSKILNHYKKKMSKDSFENFRNEFFVNKNNKEKGARELAQKAQLEEGLKSTEQIEEENQEKKIDKEIPFANIPKETKIELVANKLIQGIPLTAEEERFKNSNSIKVENKRIELEKINANAETSNEVIPEEVSEEGTVTDEKTEIAGNINNIVESQPAPEAPTVNTKSKLDTLVDKHNPKLNEQQKAVLEKELSKEKPNENLIASLLKVKKPVAQEIITQYKLNEEAVESNTDVDLINFVNDIKQQIDESGQNSINFDLETEEVVDEFGETTDALTEKSKAQLELIKRLQASNNFDLIVVPNKSIPNRYKFQIPLSNDPKEESDAAIEDDFKSFDPKEINDRLSPEAKNQLKEQVGDYLIALEEELGSEPTFEKFIRDYIVNSSKEQTKLLFDTLILGWELNGMPIENYKEVYNKVFKSRKEIASSLMQFAEEQQLVEQEAKEQVNKSNLENNTSKKPVETASGDTVFIPVPLLGDVVFRLGYNTTNLSARFIKVTTDEGEIVTLIETFEEDVDDTNKFKELLRRDKFTAGTQLSVQLNTPNLNTTFIKDRDENGQVIFDETGKAKLIQFGEWLKRNVEKKGMDFLNSQEYYDAVPLTVKDTDGSSIAYIHDVTKISTDNVLSAEQKVKQIAELRALRKYLIDTEKKGGTPKIEITGKTAGVIKEYPNNETKRIRSVNKNAVLIKGIVDNNNQVTHVYVSNGDKKLIMPIADFYTKLKIKNINEIQKGLNLGLTLDVRDWSEDGGKQVFNTKFPTLNEETVESIMNALSLGLDNTKRRTLESNLKSYFGSDKIDDFVSKFIKLTDPLKLNPNTSYFEIKDFGKKISFGVKGGEEFVIQSQEDFELHKDKLAQFLSEQRLNVKNKLLNPTIDSNELKMGLIDEDGSIIDSPFNYFEYSLRDAENGVVLENIGTAENPHFITRFQPNIEFKPIDSPNRNSNNYSSPKPETKEENKQLNNLVANTFTDEQLTKEIPNLEAQGFEFIGSTTEEKVADAKKLLSENTNESTELAKQLDDNLKEKLEQKPVQTPTPQESNAEAIADIERRIQEDLDKNKVEYGGINLKSDAIEVSISARPTGGFGVNVALPSKNTTTGFLNSTALSQEFETRKEAIDYVNETIIPIAEQKINAKYDAELKALKSQQKTEETQTPLEGFEEFFNIFAESSNVDEAIQKLIDNKTITKNCK